MDIHSRKDSSSSPSSSTSLVRRAMTLAALVVGLGGLVMVSPAGASTAAGTGALISLESSPYGKVLMVGSGQFAGYSVYQFSRNSASACTTTTATVMGMPLSCAGAETDKSADWPIVSSVGRPVAGKGVSQRLLGMVYRKDIKADQVTYGGKLLYLFDQMPHMFTGENFMETVLPLAPWHGLWSLVSPKDGSPVAGSVPVTTEALPSGPTVLAADMFQGMGSTGITVYAYSKDKSGRSSCTGACALTWPPVLTTSAPQATSGLPQSALGTIKRADGTLQLTYKKKPLYFYSQEVPQLNPATGMPANPATIGTGNGLGGPPHFGGTFSTVAVAATTTTTTTVPPAG
jgi:predicted lipoprotein with Yx(FWY)xxD motif